MGIQEEMIAGTGPSSSSTPSATTVAPARIRAKGMIIIDDDEDAQASSWVPDDNK